MEVFTEAWARACCERLNARESYRTAGASWEWPVVLVLAADPAAGVAEDRAVRLDLHRGECRGTRVATAADLEEAPYVLRAGIEGWDAILRGGTDPVSALMQGRLRLQRGNLFNLARYTDAAREMVAAAAEVGGHFPGESA